MKKTLGIVTLAILSLAAQAQPHNPARAHVQAFEARHAAQAGRLAPAASATPEIIGGDPAQAGAFPGVVALLYAPYADNHAAFFCGGTLVSDRHVLTAAHCADFLGLAEIEVLVGSQSLASGGTRMTVARIDVHPQWNPDLLSSDVAVLTLATPVVGVKPVLFVAGSKGETRFGSVGAAVTLAGWGLDSQGNIPVDLHQAALAVQSQSTCAVDSTVMCAGSPTRTQSACSGDSGGPLFSNQMVRGRWVQVGVASYGWAPCSTSNPPDGYARLGVVGGWVKEVIQQP